ncbi:hypothetical protein DV736_g6587, partial [Chaetothyriales sp. CBS 134916]
MVHIHLAQFYYSVLSITAPPIVIEPFPSDTFSNQKMSSPIPRKVSSTTFDSRKHLNHVSPTNNLQMSDIELEPSPISSFAASQPFQLLSREAILEMRREIFSTPVLANCLHATRPGSVQIRGIAPRYAPFIHSFWHAPEVLRIMSEIAGVELIPAMDYEICHVNVQLGPGGIEAVRNTPIKPPTATEQAITEFEAAKPRKQEVTDQAKPIIEWHKDSHPLRRRKWGVPRCCKDATLLTAAPAANMPERITVVTSFRPKDPTLLDETTNANIRNKSHLTELYYQWTTYRLEVIAQMALFAKKQLEGRYKKNVEETDPEGKPGLCRRETVNIEGMNEWGHEQIEYIRQTLHKMRPLEEKDGRIW